MNASFRVLSTIIATPSPRPKWHRFRQPSIIFPYQFTPVYVENSHVESSPHKASPSVTIYIFTMDFMSVLIPYLMNYLLSVPDYLTHPNKTV